MLNSFRNLAKSSIAKFLLLLLVASFALWGVGDMFIGGSPSYVARVNGEKITPKEFYNAYNQEREQFSRMLQNKGIADSSAFLKQMNLENQVLQRMLNQILLTQEAKKLGLRFSDAEIARRIRESEAFRDADGKFSKVNFAEYLRHTGLNEMLFVERLRGELQSEWLVERYSALPPVPEAAVKTLSQMQQAVLKADFISITPAMVTIKEPDSNELENYLKQNSSRFAVPETREISYLMITPELAKSESVSPDDATLQEEYEARKAEFSEPEKREVSQLLYAQEEDAQKAYAALQKNHSAEETAKTIKPLNTAISLGKITQSGLPAEMAAAVFELGENSVSKPLKTDFGWHVFRVGKISPAHAKTFDEMKPQLMAELESKTREEAASRFTIKIEDALAAGEELSAVAEEYAIPLKTLTPITSQGKGINGQTIALPEVPKFLETAFKLEEKADSGFISGKNGEAFLLHVERVNPERVPPLDSIKSDVQAAWEADAREAELARLSQKIAADLKEPVTRTEALKKYQLKPLSIADISLKSPVKLGGNTLPAALQSELFTLPPGQFSKPAKLENGTTVLASVTQRQLGAWPVAKAEAGKVEAIREQLAASQRDEALQHYISALRSRADIRVNEAALEAASK